MASSVRSGSGKSGYTRDLILRAYALAESDVDKALRLRSAPAGGASYSSSDPDAMYVGVCVLRRTFFFFFGTGSSLDTSTTSSSTTCFFLPLLCVSFPFSFCFAFPLSVCSTAFGLVALLRCGGGEDSGLLGRSLNCEPLSSAATLEVEGPGFLLLIGFFSPFK